MYFNKYTLADNQFVRVKKFISIAIRSKGWRNLYWFMFECQECTHWWEWRRILLILSSLNKICAKVCSVVFIFSVQIICSNFRWPCTCIPRPQHFYRKVFIFSENSKCVETENWPTRKFSQRTACFVFPSLLIWSEEIYVFMSFQFCSLKFEAYFLNKYLAQGVCYFFNVHISFHRLINMRILIIMYFSTSVNLSPNNQSIVASISVYQACRVMNSLIW